MIVVRKRLALRAAFFFALAATAALSQDNDLAAESHRARELMAASRFAEAIPIYESLVKALPGNTGLLLNLALAEEMAGRPARAIPHFEAVLKVQPDSLPALLSISMARLQLNQSREAIAPLRKVIKLDPTNLNALGMLAEAELDQKIFEEAATHYRELTERNAANPRAWYGLGKAYESLSTSTFDRLNRNAPESPYVAILLADTRLQRHQYRSAFFFYRQAQRKSSDLPGIHAGLAQIYRNTDHPDWAATEENREQTLPAPDCKVQEWACAFVSKHFVDATKGAGPKASPVALFWATKAYNQLALEAFEHLSELPESVEIHAFKAQILHNHKQDLESANEWRAALKLAPGDTEVKQRLAAALFDAEDYRSVMPLVEEELARTPKASNLNYLMGASLFRTEQPEKALPYLQLAVKGPTDLPAADAALGLTLLSLNKSAEAIPYLKKALVLDDDGSVHYSLARAYRAAGESRLASETMQQYQTIQKQNHEINEQLAKEAEITAPPQEPAGSEERTLDKLDP